MNTAPQKERKENHTIDFLKLFFALCIVGIHTDLVKIFPSEHTQWYVMQVVFRMGVPFFFVVSGYFLGVVPGLTKMNIRTEFLDSSSADIMMDSELESNEALKGYQTHPSHVHVADTYVRPNVSVRLSMDYEI